MNRAAHSHDKTLDGLLAEHVARTRTMPPPARLRRFAALDDETRARAWADLRRRIEAEREQAAVS